MTSLRLKFTGITAIALGLSAMPLASHGQGTRVVQIKSPLARTRVLGAGTSMNAPAPNSATATATATTERTIQADGTIVIRYADGRTRYYLPAGGTRLVDRDGKQVREWVTNSNVQALDPPPLPATSAGGEKMARWLQSHSDALLVALMSVVKGDPTAVRNGYLKREEHARTVYQKIDSRTKDLARLVQP